MRSVFVLALALALASCAEEGGAAPANESANPPVTSSADASSVAGTVSTASDGSRELGADAPATTPDDAGAPRSDAALALSLTAPPDAAPRFDRVVLVTIDTLRVDHVSAYGYPRKTSPFLDTLAERGVRFDRAMASMAHTAPSHASMLTGLPPLRHGLLRNGEKLVRRVPTLGGLFADAGFDTAAFLSVTFLKLVARDFATVVAANHDATQIADKTIEWMRAKRDDGSARERFFLWLHFYDPHRWMAPPKCPPEDVAAVVESYDVRGLDLLPRVREQHALEIEDPFHLVIKGNADRNFPRNDAAAYMERFDSYDGQIHYADREIARIYAALEALDLPGRTLWVVTSDHGEGLGQHNFLGHGMSVYNEQLHVPLIFHATDGSVTRAPVSELVQLVDLTPTLAETIGATATGYDASIDGASLWPLLEGREGWVSRPAFAQRKADEEGESTLFALQSDAFKLHLQLDGADEFYLLDEDPLELRDRVGTGAVEESALRALLEAAISRAESTTGRAVETEIQEEFLEELRDLGYVE